MPKAHANDPRAKAQSATSNGSRTLTSSQPQLSLPHYRIHLQCNPTNNLHHTKHLLAHKASPTLYHAFNVLQPPKGHMPPKHLLTHKVSSSHSLNKPYIHKENPQDLPIKQLHTLEFLNPSPPQNLTTFLNRSTTLSPLHQATTQTPTPLAQPKHHPVLASLRAPTPPSLIAPHPLIPPLFVKILHPHQPQNSLP